MAPQKLHREQQLWACVNYSVLICINNANGYTGLVSSILLANYLVLLKCYNLKPMLQLYLRNCN